MNPETNWPQRVLSVQGKPLVVLRERGPRDLYHIPLNEIAELMSRLLERRSLSPASAIKRDVLDMYELVRMTERADKYLEAAWAIRP